MDSRTAKHMSDFNRAYSEILNKKREHSDRLFSINNQANQVITKLLGKEGWVEYVGFSAAMCQAEVGNSQPDPSRLLDSLSSYVRYHNGLLPPSEQVELEPSQPPNSEETLITF